MINEGGITKAPELIRVFTQLSHRLITASAVFQLFNLEIYAAFLHFQFSFFVAVRGVTASNKFANGVFLPSHLNFSLKKSGGKKSRVKRSAYNNENVFS